MDILRWGAAVIVMTALAATLLASSNAAFAAGGDHSSCFAVGSARPCRVGKFQPKSARTVDTYWVDTDGEDPAVAGCHIEVVGMNNPKKLPEGRIFAD